MLVTEQNIMATTETWKRMPGSAVKLCCLCETKNISTRKLLIYIILKSFKMKRFLICLEIYENVILNKNTLKSVQYTVFTWTFLLLQL